MSQSHPGETSVLMDLNDRIERQEKFSESARAIVYIALVGIIALFLLVIRPYVKDLKQERNEMRQQVHHLKSEVARLKGPAPNADAFRDVLERMRQNAAKKK